MKTFFVLLGFFSYSAGAVESCPNVEGTWNSFYDKPVRFEQEGCETLVRHSGYRRVNGLPVFTVKREFALDGTPTCVDGSKCESVKIENDTLKFSFNFDARRDFADHGICLDRGTTVSLLTNGNLKVVTQVESCADGFNGDFAVEFTKWTPQIPTAN